MVESSENTPILPKKEQQKNLAAALIDAGLPFSVDKDTITIRYSTELPAYQDTIVHINEIHKELISRGMVQGQIKYTRGPVIGDQGEVNVEIEQLVYFFGSDEEFETFSIKLFPSERFSRKSTFIP